MSETHRITVDPNQCRGRPYLRGLRIRLKDVLDLLAAGGRPGRDPGRLPVAGSRDITASIEYAARQIDRSV